MAAGALRCQPSAPAPTSRDPCPATGPPQQARARGLAGAVRHQSRRGHPGSRPAFLRSAREDETL